jgi:nitroimidazol reductase NimA-like FMN-containing flavoprotein (pyridoxamine 5'-phosphate oxidase superfamily)
MHIHELTDAECRTFLEHTNLARLACSHDDQPYVVPIYFDFDGKALYSYSTHGRKIEWMRSNPNVCVAVDNIVDQFNWTTVVVFGRYEELRETPEYENLRERAAQLFRQRPEWWLPAAGRLSSADRDQVPVVFRIRITSVHGRRAIRDQTAMAAAARPIKRASETAPPWWIQVLRPKGRDSR